MFVHTRPGKCDARLQVKRLLKVTYQGAARIRHRGVYSNWLSRRQHRTEAESGVYDCLIAHFSIYFVFHAYFPTSVNQHSRKFKAVVWRGFSPNKNPSFRFLWQIMKLKKKVEIHSAAVSHDRFCRFIKSLCRQNHALTFSREVKYSVPDGMIWCIDRCYTYWYSETDYPPLHIPCE